MEEQLLNQPGIGHKTIYDDEMFKVPFDKVSLPSEGKLYSGLIPPVLDVEYMITKDEDILYSSELMSNGTIFSTLVAQKIKTPGVNVDDLLVGDFNEILLFLRKTAYGNIYITNSFDPDTQELTKKPVDLNELKRNSLTAMFNELGEFDFVLPLMNKRITFKLCTVGMMNYINNRAEQMKNKKIGVTPYITTRLETQIMSVEGKRDKLFISKFVQVIPPADRLRLMQYIESIEPGVSLNYTFKSAIKENEYTDKIQLGLDFYFPTNI